MNARDPKSLSWQLVRGAVIEEFQKKADKSQPQGALFAKKNRPKPKSGESGFKPRPPSFYKGKPCHKCHLEGHWSNDCPQKRDGKKPNSANRAEVNAKSESKVMALSARVIGTRGGGSCYVCGIESGCIHHMSIVNSDMTNFVPYNTPI